MHTLPRFRTLFAGLLLVVGLSFSSLLPAHAATVDVLCSGENAAKDSKFCTGDAEKGVFDLVKTIINVLLSIGGSIAVIMIIIGGIRYVTSNGEQSHVKAAKDTILYAVIGLVIAILAFAIVNFVVGKLS